MRAIKFRGKAVLEEDDSIELTDRIVKHGDWVHGNLIFTDNGTPYIVGELIGVDVDYTVLHYWIPVDCVGQFTGLLDKNGVEIYEGDVVRYVDKPHEWHFLITNQHDKYYGIFAKCIYRNFATEENENSELEYVFGDFYDANEITQFVYVDGERYEVIGNIHEEVEE